MEFARPPVPTSVTFRDPPPADDPGPALRQEIAQALVGAPSLPIDLPAYGMRLLTVEADRRAVELVLGFEDPVASLRLERAGRQDGTGRPVRVTVKERAPVPPRVVRSLSTMAERVEAAITAERWDRAWALAGRLRALPSGLPLTYFRQVVAGVEETRATGLVRVGFRCNQDCGMCWQGRHWGGYDADQVLRWIEDLGAAGVRNLSISGGEPTLDPALPRYVARARDLGFRDVIIETNAIRLAKGDAARALRAAGLTSAFVSLHSPDPATSDRITRALGTHERTVRGVRALLDAGVQVVLNAVATRRALAHLGDLPDFIHREFGTRVDSLMISYPTAPYDPALLPDLLPEPGALRVALRRAVDRAFAVGLPIVGLDGPCGPPLCAFDADRRLTKLRPAPGSLTFRTHVPACDACRVRQACFGVRHADVARFGEDCVAPLARTPEP